MILKIYNTLLEEYSYQGWWPVTPSGSCQGKLEPIYGLRARTDKQKLEIIFGAILTQNTSWKNVEKAIINLNEKNLINIDKILEIEHEKLAKTIKSAGYFNQKAKKLKNVSKFLKKYPISKLEKTDLDNARQLLLNVNGIGPETADSILLYALNKPIFVVDAYTKRIFTNLGLVKSEDTYEDIQKLFMDHLPSDAKLFNEYHALIVQHAKKACNKKPKCDLCSLKKICKN
ncbi:endonuclease [Candidatus Woesearchaeota archaeon B3_Woes]|nr:MAG: endonuclease [Candidatus Woesearchaeota archaeon B3_Woes]